jgi:hypothetical protein
MKLSAAAVVSGLAIAITTLAVQGAVETQNKSYTVFLAGNQYDPSPISFAAFDTQAGARTLTGVTLSLTGRSYVHLQGGSYVPASPTDPGTVSNTSSSSLSFTSAGKTFTQVGIGSTTETFPGGNFSGFFGANVATVTYSTPAQAAPVDFPLEFFTSGGPLSTSVTGFSLHSFNLPPGGTGSFTSFIPAITGQVTLTYNYVTVPEAGSLGMLGLGMIGLLGRRRTKA